MLPAEIEAKLRSHFLLQRISRARPHGPAGGALLIREMDLEAMAVLILHTRLGEGLAGPMAEPGKIPAEHVQGRLAFDHPFRGKFSKPARLRKARDQAVAAEVVLQFRYRAEQRRPVGRPDHRAIDHSLDAD